MSIFSFLFGSKDKKKAKKEIFVVSILVRDVNNKNFLVVRYSNGLWDIPFEYLRSGETYEMACKRLAREKLGVEIDVGDFICDGVRELDGKKMHFVMFGVDYINEVFRVGHGVEYWDFVGRARLKELAISGSPVAALYLAFSTHVKK